MGSFLYYFPSSNAKVEHRVEAAKQLNKSVPYMVIEIAELPKYNIFGYKTIGDIQKAASKVK